MSDNRNTNHTRPAAVAPPDCAAGERYAVDLKAYLDNELPPLRRLALARHIAGCAACKEEVRAMSEITNDLRAAGDAAATPLSPALRSRLIEAASNAAASAVPALVPVVAPPPPPRRPLWRTQPLLTFGGGAIATVVMLAVFFPLFKTSQLESVSREKSAATTASDWSQESSRAVPVPATAAAPAPAAPVAAMKIPSTEGETYRFQPPPAPAAGALPRKAVEPQVASEKRVRPESEAKARQSPVTRRPLQVAQADKPAHTGRQANEALNGRLRDDSRDYEVDRAKESRLARPDASAAGSSLALVPGATMDQRKVHREASLTVAVARLEETSGKVEETVKATGGYIASNNLSTAAEGYKTADLVVRVPVDQFDGVMKRLASLGEVLAKNVSGEDITEQLAGATAAEQTLADEVEQSAERLRVSRMSEKRTGQKEAELRQARVELAEARARLGVLRKMSTLSTISLSLTEKKPAPPPKPAETGFWGDMKETNRAASLAFQSAVRVPLVLVMWVLAFSPLWAPLLIAYKWASVRRAQAER